MYRINNISVPFKHELTQVRDSISKMIGVKFRDISHLKLLRRSLDARKGQLKYIYSAAFSLTDGVKTKVQLQAYSPVEYVFPYKPEGSGTERPVVVGAGPAGLFCALVLAENGFKPILLERGDDVDTRIKRVNEFWEKGILDTESNMQFGEGGAGTFSDGKLNTGIKDAYGRMGYVLKTLVDAGAPDSILLDNKPHVGTDYLQQAVKKIRQRIIDLGGEVRFRTCVNDLVIEDNAVKGLNCADGSEVKASQIVLALGHSSRDSFSMLHKRGLPMEAKTFAMGVRIEHSQSMINASQYKKNIAELPAADYKLSARTSDDRGVFSFCMCPGGFVVSSASETESCVTNGMSYYARDSKNANAAILVNVYPHDFSGDSPLAGVELQRQLERKAFQLGGGDYSLPRQRFGDFCNNSGRADNLSGNEISDTELKGSFKWADLNDLFPDYICNGLKEGIKAFGRKIKGFDNPDAILTGPETRSSSPVRILRGDSYESDIQGIYPCGEGAGYAGGIMSAAVDGIKVAEAVAARMRQG